MKAKPVVPTQHEGNKTDTEHTVSVVSPEEAFARYNRARSKLLDVNHWNVFAGVLSADFQLTDSTGIAAKRAAQRNDYFKINIPGPGNTTGDGYDWVRIESIQDDAASEIIAMTVRPAPSPLHPKDEVAHFFKDEATSTFIVERKGLTITASVHGRNEVPNADVEKPAGQLRNSVIAFGAFSGLSKVQWTALVKGLLEE